MKISDGESLEAFFKRLETEVSNLRLSAKDAFEFYVEAYENRNRKRA